MTENESSKNASKTAVELVIIFICLYFVWMGKPAIDYGETARYLNAVSSRGGLFTLFGILAELQFIILGLVTLLVPLCALICDDETYPPTVVQMMFYGYGLLGWLSASHFSDTGNNSLAFMLYCLCGALVVVFFSIATFRAIKRK